LSWHREEDLNNFLGIYRKTVIDELLIHARKDKRIILLVCDMGFGVIDSYRKELPDRVYNVGIMEQGTVGISAGMAMTGLIPVVYSIVNFLAFRSIEQIRNDVVNQKLNVKFIATGVNDYFKFLGPSHCCGQDDLKIMELIGLNIFDPYQGSPEEFPELVKKWIYSSQAGYIRV
jgi:transketolase